MQEKIDELKAKLAALAPNQETGVIETEAVQDGADISNDDPYLARFLVSPESEIAKLFPKLVATDVAGAKRKLAQSRHKQSLLETARNEALPIQQRIEAAVAWRLLLPASNRWAALSDADLLESLTRHPDHERLEQLSALVCDPTVPKKDWRAYLGDMWAAISEFQALQQKFPLRDTPVLLSLGAVASRVIKNSLPEVKDGFTARSEIYGYAKELQGRA